MNWIKYLFIARAILKIITDVLVPDQDGKIRITLTDASNALASIAEAAGIQNKIIIDAKGVDQITAIPKSKQ